MRTIAVILFTLSISMLYAQEQTKLDTTIWHTDYQHILAEAKESGLPILMVFSGCDWCKPCIKLKEQILSKDEFSAWAKTHSVCIILDFPSCKKNALSKEQTEQNETLAEKFNQNGVFPLVLLINGNEEVIGNIGYEDISVAAYIQKIEEILNK